MKILKKLWSWLSQPAQVHQPVEETSDKCCGKCDCAPVLTAPTDSVTEFYKNDEGYAKAVYAEVADTPVISTPVPEKKKTRKPAAITTKTQTKKPQAKKPTPSKKVPPQKKPAPKKK